jgi:hypothetical protein
MVVFLRRDDDFTVLPTHSSSTGIRYPVISLPDGGRLIIVDQRQIRTPPFNPNPPHHTLFAPLLKSNLQKAIRRKARDVALRTAWWLLAKEPTELLRRLPVILCEDTQAHARLLTEVVWLMAASSKGYHLTWADAAIVMAAVATALETTEEWNLHVSVSGMHLLTTERIVDPCVLALHVRASFGGMRGDTAFLERLRDRAAIGDLPFWPGPICWLEEDIPWLVPEQDILLEAVDQHTYPRLAHAIPDLRMDAIWWCRSAVSARRFVGAGAEEAESFRSARIAALQPHLDKYAVELYIFSCRMRRNCKREEAAVTPARVSAIQTLDRWFRPITKH